MIVGGVLRDVGEDERVEVGTTKRATMGFCISGGQRAVQIVDAGLTWSEVVYDGIEV